jgi:hypothetical protein
VADLSKLAEKLNAFRGVESALAEYGRLLGKVEQINTMRASALQTAAIPRAIQEAFSDHISKADSVAKIMLASAGPLDVVSRSMARISEELTRMPRVVMPLPAIEQLRLPKIEHALKLPEIPKLALHAHIAEIRGLDLVSRAMQEVLRAEKLGNLIEPTAAIARELHSGLADLTNAYDTLFDRMTANALITLAPALSKSPAVEFFNHVDVLAATSISKSEPELERARSRERSLIEVDSADHVVVLLSAEFPELLQLLEGARTAWENRPPDWIRHFAISLRELLTKLLHELAPDEAVRSWSTSAADFHDGRPTRKARLRFLCEPVANGGFTDFVTKDIEAVSSLIDIFHQGTHSIGHSFPEVVLSTLKARMETAISYLLQIRVSTREGSSL